MIDFTPEIYYEKIGGIVNFGIAPVLFSFRHQGVGGKEISVRYHL